jgi:hypothetical protein
MRIILVLSLAGLTGALPICAQSVAAATAPTSGRSVPIFHVTVIERTLKAVNYQHHAGPTRVDMRGTVLLGKAQGEVVVEVKSGYTELNAKFNHVEPPTQFGTEFLSYVVWAITPDGHAINLGELIPDGSNKGKMRVTCPYSTFGLLVTAEPYFSVPYPSDVVVMENAIRPDTIGRVEDIEAKAELLPRGQYTLNIKPQDLPSARMKQDLGVSMPEYEAILALYEARNAVQIARADGADQFAPDTLAKAQQYLNDAEAQYQRKIDFDNVTTTAHHAVQAASDARVIALRNKTARQP